MRRKVFGFRVELLALAGYNGRVYVGTRRAARGPTVGKVFFIQETPGRNRKRRAKKRVIERGSNKRYGG